MRLWPKSLLGQTLVAVAAALLVAQIISASLLYRGTENRREAAVLNGAAIGLLIDPAQRRGRLVQQRMRQIERGEGPNPFRTRPLRSQTQAESPLLPGENNRTRWAEALRGTIAGQGVEPFSLVVTSRRAGNDPFLQQQADRFLRFRTEPGWADRQLLVAGLQRVEGGPWQVARVPIPPRDSRGIVVLVSQTLMLFIVLMGVLYLLLRRITRPLEALTEQTERFAHSQDASNQAEPSGPHDIQRLQSAHNAMENRIAALLDEKDVMLGAIGHDLKTPLAALRVRIESVEDSGQRGKMAASIEDITKSLDDILSLARIGRTNEPPEPVQLGALVEAIVEEFEDMDEPVTLKESERIVLPVHVTWLRRAVRNLVTNALRYGGNAEVSLYREGETIVLDVADTGPGIPEDQIANMLEPFQRGEASRNRATGGAGLGLTLARAIAEQHGGQLALSNREDRGLQAQIRLPA